MKHYILVIGSSNTDMVAKAARLPAPGETILGGAFMMAPGGKGANQAVAAARLGANVTFIAKVGDDIFGKQAIEGFRQEGIDTSLIATDPVNPSGVALITVDARGENCIVVASGANANLLPADLHNAEEKIKNASMILMQLETPLETVEYVAGLAAANHVPLILNPAPARALPDELLQKTHILTPNEKEAEMLTGILILDRSGAEAAATALAARGVRIVIITMGKAGALLLDNRQPLLPDNRQFEWVPAPEVTAVDSTAAGDVFCGALTVALSEGRDIRAATVFACAAAALSVTRMGAQTSAPTRSEVDKFCPSGPAPFPSGPGPL
jgi:ribokinase